MTIEDIEANASFLHRCRDAYKKKIWPGDPESRYTEDYKKLVQIAEIYFKHKEEIRFGDYMMEGQFLVQLWTAHLILDYGNPSEDLRKKCIRQIVSYSDSPLAPELANQEKLWIENYLKQKGE